jgi:integrase
LQWAIRITWLTASRVSDWRHVMVHFHTRLIEIRYVTPWKSDPMMKRRIVKWLPRWSGDALVVWQAAVSLLVNDRKTVRAYIRTVAPNLGCHALRHGAIIFLEALGNSADSIATLTNHAPCQRFSALEGNYFAPWSPPTSAKSMECQRMAATLQAVLESP